MKAIRSWLVLMVALSVATASFADQTISSGNSANLQLIVHSTFGVDLNDGSAGIESMIDAASIWFEIFPFADVRGIPLDTDPEAPHVRLSLDASKWAFKWFNKAELPTDDLLKNAGNSSGTEVGLINLRSELDWGDFWLGIGGYYDGEGNSDPWKLFDVSKASLQNIFDPLYALDQFRSYAQFGVIKGPILTDLVLAKTKTDYPITGALAFGYRTEIISASLRAGSQFNARDNNSNAWVLNADAVFKPIKGLSFSATGDYSFNFSNAAPATATAPAVANTLSNPVTFGADAAYQIDFTDMIGIKPYVGFDGKVATTGSAVGVFNWELGGGARFYWHGADYKGVHAMFDKWNTSVLSGLSVGMNMNNKSLVNLSVGLFDEANGAALIPNLGYFFDLEIANLAAVDGHQVWAWIAELEYNIENTLVPYAFCRFNQNVKGTQLTGTTGLTLRGGLKVPVIKYLVIDLAWESINTLNAGDSLKDLGMVSLTLTTRN